MGIYFRDNDTSASNWVGLMRAYHYTNNNHSICLHAYNDTGGNKYFEIMAPASSGAGYITWSDGRINNHVYPNTENTLNFGSASLRWKSGWFNNALYITTSSSYVDAGTAGVAGITIGGGRIEMSGSTPYIDFHYNNNTADFTSRIIADTGAGRLHLKYSATPNLTYNSRTRGINLYNEGSI